jgi:hypothetical protein
MVGDAGDFVHRFHSRWNRGSPCYLAPTCGLPLQPYTSALRDGVGLLRREAIASLAATPPDGVAIPSKRMPPVPAAWYGKIVDPRDGVTYHAEALRR